MRTIAVQNMRRIKKAVPEIEDKVKVKIGFGRGKVSIRGGGLDEYIVEQIIRAVDFGFHIGDALLLIRKDFVLESIDIKSHTPRKNLRDVRARLIGRKGKAKKTIENLTGSVIVIQNNKVGIIVDSEHLETVVQGIELLIQGAKHGNVFAYIEKQNVSRRGFWRKGLGLRIKGKS